MLYSNLSNEGSRVKGMGGVPHLWTSGTESDIQGLELRLVFEKNRTNRAILFHLYHYMYLEEREV